MKFSLKWLNEFVEIQDYYSKTQELVDLLTFAGLEVESIENQAIQYEFVVTGLILKKDKHPEADRLTVCQVTTGSGVVHQIVCGAKNHNENDRVVVALPGAKLPGGLEIKESVIRNVPSKGMLCSYEELGLPDMSEGIIILPKDAPIGEKFSEYYGLNDIVFELKVTPNRADCLSHIGLAREIACLLGRELKPLASSNFLESSVKCHSGQNPFQVRVTDTNACPVYLGAYLTDVKVGPSPVWLKNRLELLGIKSINNVVDVTNYVMLERGQPLHAFDGDQILGRTLDVRFSNNFEKFVSLDGTQYKLPEGELCIADSRAILALAGIVGGQNSGVSEATQTLFLEAAIFKNDLIRKTSRRLGIQTESSYRFSRGVDGSSTRASLMRAIQLLTELAGAKWVGDVKAAAEVITQPKAIPISVDFVSQKLGYPVSYQDFLSKIQLLGCQIERTALEGEYRITPPAHRFDLESSVDLVEEYGRLNGYDKIPESFPPQKSSPASHEKEYVFQRAIAKGFACFGYNELVLPIFVDAKREAQFFGHDSSLKNCGFGDGSSISILNPLSEDQSSLRQQLSLGLVERALYNLRQGLHQGRLFEIGVVTSCTDRPKRYHQKYHLAALSWGEATQVWDKKQSCPLVIQLKDHALQVFKFLRVPVSVQKISDRSELPSFLHRGQSAWLYLNNERVGFVGQIHPEWASDHKVRFPLCLLEMNLSAIFKSMGTLAEFKPFSRYPYVERDLALVVPRNLASQSLEACFHNSLNNYLQGIELFDIYEGEKIPETHRQLGYRLRLQKQDGTLSETEVSRAMEQLLNNLKSDLGVHLREG